MGMQYINDIADFDYSSKCKFSFIEFNLILLYSFGNGKDVYNDNRTYEFFYNFNDSKKKKVNTLFYNYKSPLIYSFLKSLISFPMLFNEFQYINFLLGSEIARRLLNLATKIYHINDLFFYYCNCVLKKISVFIKKKLMINIIRNKKTNVLDIHNSIIKVITTFNILQNSNKMKIRSLKSNIFSNTFNLCNRKYFNILLYKVVSTEFSYYFTRNSILVKRYYGNFYFSAIHNPVFIPIDFWGKIQDKNILINNEKKKINILINNIKLYRKKTHFFSLLSFGNISEVFKFLLKKQNIKLIFLHDENFKNRLSLNNLKNKSDFSLLKSLNIKYIKKIKLSKNIILEISFYSRFGSINIIISGRDNQFLNTFFRYFYHFIKDAFITRNTNTLSISYEKFLLLNAFTVHSITKTFQSTIRENIVRQFSNSFAYIFRIINRKNIHNLSYFISTLRYYWKYLKLPIRQKLLFFDWKIQNNIFLSNTVPKFLINMMLNNIKKMINSILIFIYTECSITIK